MKPVLLFDWDGTIVDSNAWKWSGAWQEAFDGEPELFAVIERVLADDLDKKLSRIQLVEETLRRAREKGISPKRTQKEYLDGFGRAVREGVVRIGLFPHAKEMLAQLSEEVYRMYVISATAQEDLEHTAVVLGVKNYFAGLHGRPGEKEEHAEAIRTQEPAGATFVVIGDGESDREAARNIKSQLIGIVNEWNGWEADDSVVHKIKNIAELPKVLARITKE